MVDLFKQNKWLFLIVGVVLAGLIWYGLSERTPENLLSSETFAGGGASGSTAQSAVEREIVGVLLDLRAIRLDGQIFSDPAFQSLRDSSVDIVLEPIGRVNPFAPLTEPESESESDQ